MVPVVALIGGSIIQACNSPTPELVPAEEIERSFVEWNGRPIVCSHPMNEEGNPVSANDPRIAEKEAYGRIADPRFEDNQLILDAWLDPAKAEQVGGDAIEVIRRAQEQEAIEISVGAYVTVDPTTGTRNGIEFGGIWRDIGSDHLAMLPDGCTGACSNEMGCGPRYMATAQGFELIEDAEEDAVKETRKVEGPEERGASGSRLLERAKRLFSGLRASQSEGEMGHDEVRGALWTALNDAEPGFDWIEEIFPGPGQVIYEVWLSDGWHLKRRGYSIAEDGSVVLGDDVEEVERVLDYRAVSAQQDPGSEESEGDSSLRNEAGNCPCGGTEGDCSCPKQKSAKSAKEAGMSTKLAGRIKALIDSDETPWAESDRKFLEGLPEERLEEFETKADDDDEGGEAATDPPTEPATVTEPATASATKVEIEKDVLASLQRAAAREDAREKAQKDQLVASLKDCQSSYTEAELQAKEIDELQKIATLVSVEVPAIDYSINGASVPTGDGDVYRNPPNGYDLAIAKKAEA